MARGRARPINTSMNWLSQVEGAQDFNGDPLLRLPVANGQMLYSACVLSCPSCVGTSRQGSLEVVEHSFLAQNVLQWGSHVAASVRGWYSLYGGAVSIGRFGC